MDSEAFCNLDARSRLVDQADPYTRAYRPGDRAINYRSEPFLNRLALQQQRTGSFDESLAYSSYSFGDPATPIARSYLGDPAKERVLHGGSEVFHVHHVHGGSVRWPRQPGLVNASPAETFNVEHEIPAICHLPPATRHFPPFDSRPAL